jgi:hypothetical protein
LLTVGVSTKFDVERKFQFFLYKIVLRDDPFADFLEYRCVVSREVQKCDIVIIFHTVLVYTDFWREILKKSAKT